jgi:L-threonylcarbamoyladenylate synthase
MLLKQAGAFRLSAEVVKLNARNADLRAIRYAVQWIQRGSVVAIPTDTLYALAADPVNLSAVDAIFRVKGRPESRALTILINSMDQAMEASRELPDNFFRLAEACWPGPLSIVVEASNRLPLKVTANTRRIALRWPKCEIAQKLVSELGAPLACTSANLSGSPTCSTGEEAFDQLGDRIPLILDSGQTLGILPSTIVELRGDHWCIGREGAIPSDDIRAVLDPSAGLGPIPSLPA